ncbi:MAG: hypothetical protein ACJAUZ_001139 [Flavobacteriaceae bacterium]|jgi:hypothetical protein
MVNVNTESNTLQTIAISPPKINLDQIHQLWIVKPNDAGVSSIGLLPQLAGSSTTLKLTREAIEATVFAVSLEPQGGSPEPAPTGPVLFTGSTVLLRRLTDMYISKWVHCCLTHPSFTNSGNPRTCLATTQVTTNKGLQSVHVAFLRI